MLTGPHKTLTLCKMQKNLSETYMFNKGAWSRGVCDKYEQGQEKSLGRARYSNCQILLLATHIQCWEGYF